MKTAKAITAPRRIRSLYYAAEYGTAAAAKLLAVEASGIDVVRVPSGTAGTCGLFRTIRDARHWQTRVTMFAAFSAGRIGQSCPGMARIEVEPVDADRYTSTRWASWLPTGRS